MDAQITIPSGSSGGIVEGVDFVGGTSFFTADGVDTIFDIVHNLGFVPRFFTLTTTEPNFNENC